METNFGLKLNNCLKNMKNKFSSIFSRLFRRKNMKNEEKTDEKDIRALNCYEKIAKNDKKDVNFVQKPQKLQTKNSSERGVIPPFLIKIIVAVVITVVIALVLWIIFYNMIMNASLTFTIDTIKDEVKRFFVWIFYSVARWILLIVDIISCFIL